MIRKILLSLGIFGILVGCSSHSTYTSSVAADFNKPKTSAFSELLAISTSNKIISVDTVAGVAKILISSPVNSPAFVFLYASGGDGRVYFESQSDGSLVSRYPGNPAFIFAPEFIKRKAAWAIVALPEKYRYGVSPSNRLTEDHIESIAQTGRKLKSIYPNSKVILIGHSNGGITAGMQAIRAKPDFDAIVMSAPNLEWLPRGWTPEQSVVPIMFITHKLDQCRGTYATETIRMAGGRFPLTVIDLPTEGRNDECFYTPSPHFFTNAHDIYAESILLWVSKLPL
jgi:predicted esterase